MPLSRDCQPIEHLGFSFTVRLSRRASRMRLVVRKEDGRLQVVIPVAQAPYAEDLARGLVQSQQEWLTRTLSELSTRSQVRLHPLGVLGLQPSDCQESWWDPPPLILFQGRRLPLRLVSTDGASPAGCLLGDQEVVVHLDRSTLGDQSGTKGYLVTRVLLTRGLFRRAFGDASRMARQISPRLGLEVPPIRLTGARRRWGSCNSRGVVRINWRLIHLPSALMEYVVAHELCHLRHRHHQPPFWEQVESLLPDWKERRKALRAWEERYTILDG